MKAGNSIRTRTSIPSRFRCSGLHTLQEYVQEKCSEMTPLVLLANNTDSPINIAKDGFIAGYGSDCDVEYLADDWTGYVSASLAYRKMSDWAVDYDFIFPVAGGSNAGIYRYSREFEVSPYLCRYGHRSVKPLQPDYGFGH